MGDKFGSEHTLGYDTTRVEHVKTVSLFLWPGAFLSRVRGSARLKLIFDSG